MDGRAGRRSLRLADLTANPTATVGALALAVAVGANVWVLLRSAATALATPHSLDYVEGFLVRVAADPGLWYHPIEEAPYLLTSYPPLYYAATWALSTVVDPLLAGRLVSMAATLAVAGLVAASVRAIAPSAPLAAGVAALLFLASPLVPFWGVFARADMLGVALGLAALYWFYTREGRRAVWGAVALCLLSLFTKQSLLAAPSAIGLTLIARGEGRRSAEFFGGLGAFGLAGLAAMHALTDGRSTLHMVVYNAQPPVLDRFVFFLGTYSAVHAVVIAGAFLAVAYNDRIPLLFRAYAAASVPVAAMALKAGSQFNFFLDALVASTVLVGALLGTELRTPAGLRADGGEAWPTVGRSRIVVLVVLALTLQFGMFWFGGFSAGLPERPDPGAAEAAASVEGVDGPVLSEDARVLVAGGHEVGYQPNLMRSLSRSGRWDQTPVTDRIRTREYDAIVLKSRVWSTEWPHRFTREQKVAIDRNYELRRREGTYWVYVPESDGEDASPATDGG